MELVAQLRSLLNTVDASLLTAQDRLALLDLFERSLVGDCSAA
jgi:hypothetical protein